MRLADSCSSQNSHQINPDFFFFSAVAVLRAAQCGFAPLLSEGFSRNIDTHHVVLHLPRCALSCLHFLQGDKICSQQSGGFLCSSLHSPPDEGRKPLGLVCSPETAGLHRVIFLLKIKMRRFNPFEFLNFIKSICLDLWHPPRNPVVIGDPKGY